MSRTWKRKNIYYQDRSNSEIIKIININKHKVLYKILCPGKGTFHKKGMVIEDDTKIFKLIYTKAPLLKSILYDVDDAPSSR